MQVKFFKVTELPVTLEPDAFYYVQGTSYTESYLTDNAGVAKSVGNTEMIDERIFEHAKTASSLSIAADIAARDALTTPSQANMMILVLDASADPTVDSGSALYAYSVGDDTSYKVSEYESMDVSLTWASIIGKPTSSVANIDDAVTKRHAHANKTVLDKWTESEGKPLYDGQKVVTEWETNSW